MNRLLFALLAMAPMLVHSAEIAGVRLAPTATVAGQQLKLNGAGLRQKAFFKIYVAALYLPARLSASSQVLGEPGAKRISLVVLRDITAAQLIDALSNGVRDNHTRAEIDSLRARIDTLNRTMTEIGNAKSGSIITLDFVPGSGTHVGLNGAAVGGAIEGEDFYRALLRIWLGDDPADETLKKALLGMQ